MPENIRALIVVVTLAIPVFYIGQQIANPIFTPRQFKILRNIWFSITIAAFLSGNFFIFAIVLLGICLYAYSTRIAGPPLYFILLFATPLANVSIGGFDIINRLIDLNSGRLLSIFLLSPILFVPGGFRERLSGRFSAPDWIISTYVLLMIALNSRGTEFTNAMRIATLYALDVLIPYFVFSRAITSIPDVRKTLLALVLAVLPLALTAVFETFKNWHLYSIVAAQWGEFGVGYLTREGILRGSATSSVPIVLGLVIMTAIGSSLATFQSIPSRQFAGTAWAILGAGIIGTLSRGPWVGTAVLVIVYIATGPNAGTKLSKLALASVMTVVILSLTPFGTSLLEFLPFTGTVEPGSVLYRQALFDNAMIIIKRNIWFGSEDYRQMPELMELIQGAGIVDIVNHYVKIALDGGLAGLSLFCSFFGIILIGLRRALGSILAQDNDLKICVRAVFATLVAILVTIATVSAVDYVGYVLWCFGGLGVALIRISNTNGITRDSRPALI